MTEPTHDVNTTALRIDAHHHLWRYNADEFGWINEQMRPLRRDFLPHDLKPLLDRANLSGAVAVQACQSLEETRWLLSLADDARNVTGGNRAWMKGVVGWAPIAAAEFPEILADLAQNTKLKGLRHIVQDESDDQFILDPAFNRGIRALRETGLVYDILIRARHLPQTLQFVDMHPDQLFVLDHCAKPPIATRQPEPQLEPQLEFWSTHIRQLARRPNVCCKLSGLVTEAEWEQWTPATLEPYWRVVLDAFGPSRLLFGSDWPVALLASTYQQWVDTVTEWVAPLAESERNAIWGGTASRVYSL